MGNSAEIYSVAERPVVNPPPPDNELVITVVANGSNSHDIARDLWDQLDLLSAKFECEFIDLVRFGKFFIQ